MKILHCADVHLDSAMERNLSPAAARQRNAEICRTFGRMVTFAREENVGLVLIAGDLFDTRRASRRTAEYVLDLVRQLDGVDFLYLRGNHDEGRDVFSGLELPANFKTFTSQWQSFRYGNVVVTGLELNGDNALTLYDSLELNREDFNIVMLHGQDSVRPGEELIALPLLRGKYIDYLALGHLHSYRSGRLDDRGIWCYPGCLEGRGFDECGEKGFVLLDTDSGSFRPEFHPFAFRRLHEVDVDVTQLQTLSAIHAAMETAAAGIPQQDAVKFNLRGACTPQTRVDPDYLKRMLEDRYYFVKVKDQTRLRIDPETYAHDLSLKGEFIRMVMASDRPEPEKEAIILAGLRALSGEEVAL